MRRDLRDRPHGDGGRAAASPRSRWWRRRCRAITPCGGCRQRLKEFGTAETLVHLCDANGHRRDGDARRPASEGFRARLSMTERRGTERGRSSARGRRSRRASASCSAPASAISPRRSTTRSRSPMRELEGFPVARRLRPCRLADLGQVGGRAGRGLAGRAHYYEHGRADAMRAGAGDAEGARRRRR